MPHRVLIITNEAADAQALLQGLAAEPAQPFEVEWLRSLGQGLQRLHTGGVDLILAELYLPDSQGMTTLERLNAAAPHTPVMTLCAPGQQALAQRAAAHGSHGYLMREHYDSYLAAQSLRNLVRPEPGGQGEPPGCKQQARAGIMLDSIGDAVLGTDLDGKVEYLNVAAQSLTGWSRDEAHGVPIGEVMHIVDGATQELARNPAERVLELGAAVGMTTGSILIRRDGSTVPIEDNAAPIRDDRGRIDGAVVVFHDMSAALAGADEMKRQAQHDFLTGLPNRILLNDRIAQAIAQAARNGTHLAVLFLDLDNFKQVNDTLGHALGDQLLQSVARRLSSCVRDGDTVSRQGGDEFVLLLAGDQTAEHAALSAQRILSAMALPHRIDGHELHVTCSVGISVYPLDACHAETLIQNADKAMYHAKQNGCNNYQFFRDDMNVLVLERQAIEAQLQRALERGEFVLHYQPKVNLMSGAITGAEALVRWLHPQRGLMLPGRFMPVAEQSGLIVPIGRWVLREACMQVRGWDSQGLRLASIAVNISAQEFRREGFVDGVRETLAETGLDPARLQLEITEIVLMRDAEASTVLLHQLKATGVQLAVDDFGTGYSSLSYLMEFPIDVLKIDPSFVREIDARSGDGDQASAVGAVIAMGSSLNQQVVAEGIEKSAQLSFLKDQQCQEGQGYLFSRPLSADAFETLLAMGQCVQRVA
jgi:diguanylate cyclase (GGDEF)-like protein/PAS domain S-box-containing protein